MSESPENMSHLSILAVLFSCCPQGKFALACATPAHKTQIMQTLALVLALRSIRPYVKPSMNVAVERTDCSLKAFNDYIVTRNTSSARL